MRLIPQIGATGEFPVVGYLHEQENGPTSYRLFFAECGCDGLARVVGHELHILAIAANQPGTGQFREFVRQAKAAYRFIRFWTMMNDDLCQTLTRYGFYGGQDVDEFGEMQSVYDWTAPQTENKSTK